MKHTISITNFHTNDDIRNAKRYMRDYKELLNAYNSDIGVIGRFFEKLFGSRKYSEIEKRLEYRYNMSYSKAMIILYETKNEKYIFDPFKKEK